MEIHLDASLLKMVSKVSFENCKKFKILGLSFLKI